MDADVRRLSLAHQIVINCATPLLLAVAVTTSFNRDASGVECGWLQKKTPCRCNFDNATRAYASTRAPS